MGFLATLLPGVREFRTPFVVGALWTTSVVLFTWHYYDGDVGDLSPIANVYEIVGHLPDTLQLGVLAFTIYLAGLVARGIQDWIPNWHWWERCASRLPGPRRLSGSSTKDYLADAARERFANYPPAVREVARQILLDEYELADVILTSKSPEQYQEYDRWRSEAEFRNGIWFPLLLAGTGLGLVAGGTAAWLISAAIFIVSIMLKLQGVERRRLADQRLASAVYFDLASTPLFDALLSEMSRRTLEQTPGGSSENSPSDWKKIAWTIDFLRARDRDSLIRALLLHAPERDRMRQILNGAGYATFDHIRKSNLLNDLLLFAYGGVGWDKDAGTLASGSVRPGEVLNAYNRLIDHLWIEVEYGNINGVEISERGVRPFLSESHVNTLKGEATDEEWDIAIKIEDNRGD